MCEWNDLDTLPGGRVRLTATRDVLVKAKVFSLNGSISEATFCFEYFIGHVVYQMETQKAIWVKNGFGPVEHSTIVVIAWKELEENVE